MKVLAKHILLMSSIALISPHGLAQSDYPVKTVRLIVPFPPGGTTDIVARTLGQAMSKSLGQQIIIDNRPGANGAIGAEIAARSPADGYTAFMTSASILAITPHLRKDLGYSVRDFSPASLAVITPNVLVAHPSIPVKNVKELIALAKSKPNQISFGSSGVASIGHIVVEQIRAVTGAQMIHVPYKGAAPAESDLLSGHIALMATGLVSAMPHLKSGRLRALAVTTAKRVPALADLPTIAETVPGVDTGSWFGILLPTGSPMIAVERIGAAAASAIRSPELRERLSGAGAEIVGSTPSEFAKFIQSESDRYARILKESGISLSQ
ncbi:MAG: tripartite tricarboxylate transporter substrate binding protein [Sulfuricaulis sp.]|uniref:Bug family tripartite tricarboxylate transporter substrate binding protein n=1 Tax=Sulfuricaulis sp. TaxID=2003553 RepID=UPI0034A2C4F8